MLVQPVPSLHRRDLPFQVNAAAEVEQFFDDGPAGLPRRVGFGRLGRSGDEWSRHHHDMIGWVCRRRVGRMRNVFHAWILEGQDEVDGCFQRIHLGTMFQVKRLDERC